MNNNRIVVFWDNKGFDAELRQNASLIVCHNYNDFKALDDKTFKEAMGFLVLCELPWDDESAVIPRTAFGGIRLVQRFIRKKMNLRAPVVFASMSDANTICDKHPNYRIIKTPALKHFFKELPASSLEELISLLGENNMTETELAYTKLVYCDMKGMLVQMNHFLEGRNRNEQERYRKDIEYIIQNQFNNEEELVKECKNSTDLSGFCKILLSRMGELGEYDKGFLYEKNHDTIKILMIDDEAENDENVKRFVNYVQDIEQNAINKTAIEIEDLERKIDALKNDVLLKKVENELIKETISLKKKANQFLKGLDEKEHDKVRNKELEKMRIRIKAKIVSLENKTDRLDETKKGEEIRQDLKRKEALERSYRPANRSIELEYRAISLVQDAKAVKLMANSLVAIAMTMEKLAKAIGEDDLVKQAVLLGCEANTFKNRAKTLEKQQFTKSLFTIIVEKNADNIACDPTHDYKRAIEKKYSLKEFDVVISDIEIWDDNDFLATLGFNVVETMAKVQKRPIYYIVTNVSRSFYDQIKIPYVRRVRLKKEVFGTRESIETFLYGIKEVYDHREEVAKEKETKTEVLFNKLYVYIKEDIKTFNIIENDVKEKSLELIKIFLGLFSKKNLPLKDDQDSDGQNFKVFNDHCKEMRSYIKNTMTLGNENLYDIVSKLEKNNQEPTKEVIERFVNRLILRRFFLYVRCFIDFHKLMSSFDRYKKQNTSKIKIKKEDIACRAISEQHKTLEEEPDNERARNQSQCLSEILLFTTIKKQKNNAPEDNDTQEKTLSRLTDEEQSFIKALNEDCFTTNKQSISKLVIEY